MSASSPSGILPDSRIRDLIDAHNVFVARRPEAAQIQPASLDLRLGDIAYRVRASFLPGPNVVVADRLQKVKLHEFSLAKGAVLETGCVYIIPLMESLRLPEEVAAAANPKSSTGRLDVFTRVITDRAREFDKIPAGYYGPLYLEVRPRSRSRAFGSRHRDPVCRGVRVSTTRPGRPGPYRRRHHITGDLGGTGIVGYRARAYSGVIDTTSAALTRRWEPIRHWSSS